MNKKTVAAGRIIASVIVAALFVCMAAALLVSVSADTGNAKQAAMSPIVIDGNSGFTSANGTTSGSGTALDPYIIENLEISANASNGIEISNTDAYFVIRNCTISDSEFYNGIALINVTNALIENNSIENSMTLAMDTTAGIWLGNSNGNTISGNSISYGNAVRLEGSSNNTIEDNEITDNEIGIFFKLDSDYTRVTGNTITDNVHAISFWGYDVPCNYNNISLNTISGNDGAIFIDGFCDANYVTGNTIADNSEYAVKVKESNDCVISGNTLSNNGQGIFILDSLGETVSANVMTNDGLVIDGTLPEQFVHTVDSSNTVNGNPVVYHAGASSLAIDGQTAGQIILVNCTDSAVTNSTVSGTETGLLLAYCEGVDVSNSIFSNNDIGVMMVASGSNTVTGNTLSGNDECIYFKGGSTQGNTGNTLAGNTMTIIAGQVGLYFASEESYDNAIDTTNTVNGVAVQWHTNLAGTSTAPVMINGAVADVAGMTNVAQIMIYNSDYVELVGCTASNGDENGILLYNSDNIAISAATSSNNKNGIYLDASGHNTITNSTLQNNEQMGLMVFTSSPSNTVVSSNITGNLAKGIFVVNSASAVTAVNNWWGDASGPYHATLNANGTGDNVTDYVTFDPWLTSALVSNTPPPQPVITSGALCTTGLHTLTWNAVTDANGDSVTYSIQVGTTSGGSDVLAWTSTGNATNYGFTAALADGTYYAQVRSYDGTAYSTVVEQSFVVNTTTVEPSDDHPDDDNDEGGLPVMLIGIIAVIAIVAVVALLMLKKGGSKGKSETGARTQMNESSRQQQENTEESEDIFK